MNSSVERSRNGHEVLYVNGKATASLIDPVKEAAVWADSVLTVGTIGKDDTLVVIGAGSGYHLAALREKTDRKIVAIDTCQTSMDFVKARFSQLGDIKFVTIPPGTTFSEFFRRNDVVEWAFEPFTLIRHRSSMVRNGDLGKIDECLVGRTVEAFRAQLESRPSVAAALNSSRLKKLAEVKFSAKGLLSVRDLTSVWEVASEPSNERRLLRVLEELVR